MMLNNINKIFIHGILGLSLVMTSCSEDKESYTVKKQDIVESVYSSVVVEPESIYTVNASNSGYIDDILVEVGDSVVPNQVLVAVRDVMSTASMDNALLAYQTAKTNYRGDVNLLDDLKLELKDAKNKLKNDSVNYFRNKSLFAKELISLVEWEQSEFAYESSKTRVKLLKNRITRSEMDLKTALAQARINYESSLARSGDAIIRNKLHGIVYDLFKEKGEFVVMQEPVAIVGSKDKFKVKMRIDEVDITKVKVGQKIIISLESYKDQAFEGKVTRISPKMDTQTQTFEIEGEFVSPPDTLFMGLTGEGNIVVKETIDAIVIPLEYLVDGDHVITDSGKKKVKVGARSLSHAEIVSGLEVGTTIYKSEE
jgi:multidrug efflux pump subunit AcrA (membrane-fusion protein)